MRATGIGLFLLVLFSLRLNAGGEKAPSLAGTWTGGGFEIVLRGDGSGTLRDSDWSPAEPIGWKASAGTLAISEDGETTNYRYAWVSGKLRLSGGDLDQPVTLTRTGAAAKAAPAEGDEGDAPAPAARPAHPAAAKPAPAPKPGSCPGACRHYLRCAQAADAANQAQCVAECREVGYEASFLGWFESTDCATAVAVVAYLDQQQRGFESGGGQGGGGQSSECQGCVWDGSECNWYSQSNWGQGAYSGAVISCNASCCGH